MVCFLLNTYEVVFFVHAPYGERSVHVSVRITLRHDKNRQEKAGRFHHAQRYTRCTTFSAARSTDILRGSYLVSEQSPASSQTAPTQALHNNTIRKLYCQDNFSLFCKNFSHFSCAYCPVIFIPSPALPAYILNVYNKLVSPLSLPGFSPILHFRKFTAIKC